jgi:hypothetical protein
MPALVAGAVGAENRYFLPPNQEPAGWTVRNMLIALINEDRPASSVDAGTGPEQGPFS